ncbi:toll-like receptor 22 [Leuresthes tenuis]|uniref:toll-like receptor 22 n=1 Tax=Leuresthes tenuis TaxID=355514 RepID=UPI003B50BE61
MYVGIFVIPVRGFILKNCRITNNGAICVGNKLTAVPRDVPQTVVTFDLSANRISRIQPSDFTALTVLRRLDINRNNISHIDSRAFASLISLQKLNLNNNKLVHLGENVFDGLSSLIELRIASNHIKVVAATAFKSMTNLKFLDMSYNKLQKLAKVRLILQHLPKLHEVVLIKNDLNTFHSWELTNRSLELSAIDLSQNAFKDFRITGDVFTNLTRFNIGEFSSKKPMIWDVRNSTFLSRVSSLDISGLPLALHDMQALLGAVNLSLTSLRMNKMTKNLGALINMSCAIPTMSKLQFRRNKLNFVGPYFFKLCVNVTELDLTDNRIHFIHENAFRSLTSLRILTLSRNRLSCVPSATRNLPFLSKLDLSSNNISVLYCYDFDNQTKLTQLSLYQNSIPALEECVFKDLVLLQVLKLQTSQIVKLKGAFRKHLGNLTRLYLNGNKLTAIQPKEFEGLKSLQNLSLHENQIKQLHNNSFFGLTNLLEIQLQSNLIREDDINTGAFNALTNLRRLDLRDNHFSYKKDTVLTNPPFSNLSHLRELSIPGQHHRLKSHLPINFLQGLTNLTLFSARNIHLTYLHKDTFNYTPNLETLDLSANEFSNLSPQLFLPIQNLKSLYISRTVLKLLDFFIDANLTKLQFLQAKNNQFSVITKEVINSLPALVFLDFQGNSFTCDCDNAFFINWMEISVQTQVAYGYTFNCSEPADFKNKRLLDFDTRLCSVDTGFIYYASTTCMILCLMVASFTHHFMKWQLVYAYNIFLAWLFDTKYKNKQAPNQYDAFISYNTHDEPWVIGELLPKLEGQQGWRLCLHHRDFEPGRAIIDNITDAIYGSRKTICVISRRYLESEWCSREVQTASFRLFDEHRDVLILVFLEEIPTYLLSPFHRMRKLLKRQTYLSWPRAANHPEVFWEKLRQALQSGDDLGDCRFTLNVVETA